jgi:antitoxin ParD1/3/4
MKFSEVAEGSSGCGASFVLRQSIPSIDDVQDMNIISVKGDTGMARNTTISLGDHFASFVDEQVQAGRYGSASDVVRAGLRLLEEHEAKLKALEDALREGEESGLATEFDPEKFKAQMRAEHGSQ